MFKTDNRWSPGASLRDEPEDRQMPSGVPAAYSARWIDHNTWIDIVPDRQGFAYDDTADRDRLIDWLQTVDLRKHVADSWHRQGEVGRDAGHAAYRKAGGYVYVDAWLLPPGLNAGAAFPSEADLEAGWRYEVANGDTRLGVDAWLAHQREAARHG